MTPNTPSSFHLTIKRFNASAIILAAAGGKALCLEIMQAVAAQRAVLIQACVTTLHKSKAQQLHAAVASSASHVAVGEGQEVVAAQLCGGTALAHALKSAAERYGGHASRIVVLHAAAAVAAGQLCFSQWRTAALWPRRHKVELRLREPNAVNAHERGWRRRQWQRRWVILTMVLLLMVT